MTRRDLARSQAERSRDLHDVNESIHNRISNVVSDSLKPVKGVLAGWETGSAAFGLTVCQRNSDKPPTAVLS